jgi:hypothetical protein
MDLQLLAALHFELLACDINDGVHGLPENGLQM